MVFVRGCCRVAVRLPPRTLVGQDISSRRLSMWALPQGHVPDRPRWRWLATAPWFTDKKELERKKSSFLMCERMFTCLFWRQFCYLLLIEVHWVLHWYRASLVFNRRSVRLFQNGSHLFLLIQMLIFFICFKAWNSH